ncbi:hypothetical protein [Alysiella filiformis]|uniref:4-amino-4-deoxy-L-arabinose transferase n=1 Tax=Alysiella filiformis DSM 16848 TaxID=1120981 RepID=A0A286EFG3_9NEIS|nr:hypothetical protein [Alysiella filiformis]QMT30662.1 glycosyltransferase family 39 protein [Alysiella filiformis]UBQ56360.1 glycosyltransferase family 39 protein [Alysiella filiformis DSM 16848]SOD69643.1 4-amino-4-deoxy-L-arabinose transferase [Alysiella filiformis DSM 16848]
MLTYTPPEHRPQAPTHEYPWLLLLLVFAWLWAGVFSHDLWNPIEPRTYAAITESQSVWLPTVLGEAHFHLSPLYLAVAGSLKTLFAPHIMNDYAAARLASVVFTVVGLIASGMASSKLLGRQCGRSTVLILIGAAGLLPMAHFVSGMSVAFAGASLCLWGLAVSNRQVVWAALLLGAGGILLGQTLGWLATVVVLLLSLSLLAHPQWFGHRLLTVTVGAMVLILPAFAIQLFILAKINPAAFQIYVGQHIFGAWGGLNGIQAAFNLPYYAKHLLWFAFPAYPLAIWSAIRMKGLLRHKLGALSVAWLFLFGMWLVFNPQMYQDNLIVLLPILAILGAAQLDCLRRGVAAFLNWFGIMAFGAAAVFLWVGFVAIHYGVPSKLAERAAYFSPYHTPDIDIMPMMVAILFTPAWLFAITRKRIRGRQAVTNWAAGMTLVWALTFTLFADWLNAAKSYRPIVQQMQAAMPNGVSGCLKIAPQHHAARLAWQEYGHLPIQNEGDCAYELHQIHPKEESSHWQKRIVWQGKRPRNKHEAFILLKNEPHSDK